jgi:hypothetical protein
LSLVCIIVAGVNLLRPRWTTSRACVRLATDAAGTLLFCALCSSNILASISVAGVAAEKTLTITHAINLWAWKAVPAVVLVGLIVFAFDVRRIVRARAAARAAILART